MIYLFQYQVTHFPFSRHEAFIKYKSSIFIECLMLRTLSVFHLNWITNPVELFVYDAICVLHKCLCHWNTRHNIQRHTNTHAHEYTDECTFGEYVCARAPVLYSLFCVQSFSKIIARVNTCDNMWNHTKHTSQWMKRMGWHFSIRLAGAHYALTVPFKFNINNCLFIPHYSLCIQSLVSFEFSD